MSRTACACKLTVINVLFRLSTLHRGSLSLPLRRTRGLRPKIRSHAEEYLALTRWSSRGLQKEFQRARLLLRTARPAVGGFRVRGFQTLSGARHSQTLPLTSLGPTIAVVENIQPRIGRNTGFRPRPRFASARYWGVGFLHSCSSLQLLTMLFQFAGQLASEPAYGFSWPVLGVAP